MQVETKSEIRPKERNMKIVYTVNGRNKATKTYKLLQIVLAGNGEGKMHDTTKVALIQKYRRCNKLQNIMCSQRDGNVLCIETARLMGKYECLHNMVVRV